MDHSQGGKIFQNLLLPFFFFNFHSFGCNMLLDIKSFLAEKKNKTAIDPLKYTGHTLMHKTASSIA